MIKYKKMRANFEYLSYNPTDLIESITSQPVRNQKQVEEAVENFRSMARLTKVRQGQADTWLIGNALWAWDAVRGYKTMAEVGMAVYQMMYLDALEDLSLMTGEGVQNFDLMFTKDLPQVRGLVGDENEICTIDESVACDSGRNASLGVTGGSNITELVRKAFLPMQGVLACISTAANLSKL